MHLDSKRHEFDKLHVGHFLLIRSLWIAEHYHNRLSQLNGVDEKMFHAIGQCEVLSPHTVNFTVILACSDFHLRRLIQTNNYRSKKENKSFSFQESLSARNQWTISTPKITLLLTRSQCVLCELIAIISSRKSFVCFVSMKARTTAKRDCLSSLRY